MAHFGVLSYQGTGHLNPLITLALKLVSQGHTVTFFLPPDCESRIREQGLGFVPIDISGFMEAAQPLRESSNSTGWSREVRIRLNHLSLQLGAYLREYLSAIQSAGIDALLMGEIVFVGPTVAEVLQIPYFVISTSIPHNAGWNAPEAFMKPCTWQERIQKKIFEVSIFHMRGPVRQILNAHRRRAGLEAIHVKPKAHPELAHITQWPRCLEDPHHPPSEGVSYTGPFVEGSTRRKVEFPWHKLDGRPLVYASLGTTRNADAAIYYRIASACAELDVQLVITLGGRRSEDLLRDLPGNPLVVKEAPQLDLLARADMVVTHAGPNTVLETLLHGKPMLALPVLLDQPAVATRLERLGIAEALSPHSCSVDELRAAIVRIMEKSSYREASEKIQKQLQSMDGTALAASLIDHSLALHAASSCTADV